MTPITSNAPYEHNFLNYPQWESTRLPRSQKQAYESKCYRQNRC
jgi:hypothetical protein